MKKPNSLFTGTALALLLAAGMAPAGAATGENQQQPLRVSQAADQSSMEVPRRGQTKDAVRARFGTPAGMKGPIGEPPISLWFYDRFVVYFERDRVIHSVIKPARSS